MLIKPWLMSTAARGLGKPTQVFNLIPGVLPSGLTFSNVSNNRSYFDSSGVLQYAAADVPRFDYDPLTLAPKGLLVEAPLTNFIRNNTMVGAVAGTPGTPPTNWGLPATTGGIACNVIGTGIENGINYIDIRYVGTTTGAANLDVSFESTTSIAAGVGTVVTLSSYNRIVGGSAANITNIQYIIKERNNFGAPLVTGTGPSGINANSAPLGQYRYHFTYGMTSGSAFYALPILGLNWTGTGVAIDITLRIGMPQVELTVTDPTSVIPTSGSTVTRAADILSTSALGWYTNVNGTYTTEHIYRALRVTGNSPACAVFDNGTLSNRRGIGSTTLNHPNGYIVVSGSASVITDTYGNWPIGSVIKSGMSFAPGSNVMSVNGVTNSTSTFATAGTPSGINILRFARDADASMVSIWLQNFKFYKTSLSAAKLQELTT